MLNVIYAGSIAISIAISPIAPVRSVPHRETLPTQEQQTVNRIPLAEGRRYESDYRNEADRARERHQEDREDYRRENYRYDPYRVEYDREDRGRIHRDAEQRRREENLESEPRYRDRNRPNRSRDRGHRSIYYWRQY